MAMMWHIAHEIRWSPTKTLGMEMDRARKQRVIFGFDFVALSGSVYCRRSGPVPRSFWMPTYNVCVSIALIVCWPLELSRDRQAGSKSQENRAKERRMMMRTIPLTSHLHHHFRSDTFIRLNGQFNENNLTDSLGPMRIQPNIMRIIWVTSKCIW